MTLETIIQTYGYGALVIGTFLEGETILVLAGFLAHRGYLSLPWVIASAFAGSLSGDQLFFLIGRYKGLDFVRKRPAWELKTEKVYKLLRRYQTLLIIGFRFIYGMRTITPFAIGMSGVSIYRFGIFNGVGAVAWAICFGTAGFAFGATFEALLGSIRHIEREIISGIIITGVVIWLVHVYRRKRKKPVSGKSGDQE